jgi:hypothetical protein
LPTTLVSVAILIPTQQSKRSAVSLLNCPGTVFLSGSKGYISNVSLPRIPPIQSAKSRVQVQTILDYYKAKYTVPAYNSPSSIVESVACAFSPAWHSIAINT